jgi:hypothetical protein
MRVIRFKPQVLTLLSGSTLVFLTLMLITGCTDMISAGAPLGAALSSCSIAADAKLMLPETSGHALPAWAYPISAVHVIGPVKSTVPPPILAATFGKALETALRQADALEPGTSTRDTSHVLVANMISQNRHGTFAMTSLELTIEYSLHVKDESGQMVWKTVITTTDEIRDWKTDACKRLRNLQEELSKQNIRRLFKLLPNKK